MWNEFEYLVPRSWTEACSFLAANPHTAKVLAGGTDILVRCREGHLEPEYLVDIKNLPGAREISETEGGGISIGAATPLNQIERFLQDRPGFAALRQAVHSVGSYQVRNRASLGGNICNASPAADSAPALLILGATLSIVGLRGERSLPLGDFFLGPGKTALEQGEVVKSIELPFLVDGAASVYIKTARTKAVDLALVGVAALLRPDRRLRIALGAVAPRPLLVSAVEEWRPQAGWTEEALEKVVAEVVSAASPITDLRATAGYRSHMVAVQTRRALAELLGAVGVVVALDRARKRRHAE